MNELPEKIGSRIELARLYCPLDRNESRRWGRIFHKGFDVIVEKLKDLAHKKAYDQKVVSKNTILWLDKKDSNTECMIYLVDDATDLGQAEGIFKRIKKYRPFFTYVIVHQRKDGEGTYDIFRFSRFSYLEHCNRVRAR